MGRGKKYQPEQVVNLLRQIEVAVANGKTTAQASKEAGIVEQTYFRWRKEYGGLQVDQAKRLKGTGAGELEAEAFGCEQTYGNGWPRQEQRRCTLATNSGPLSERRCSGTPFITMTSASAEMTLALDQRRSARTSRLSRVCSSIRLSSRTLRPSCV
jgi:Transposase